MPSVLVETGFLTNPTEGAFLNSEKGKREMSTAIASAILDYKKELLNTVQDAPIYETLPEPDPIEEPIVKTSEPKTTSEQNNQPIHFRIQIAAGKNNISITPKNFRGLKGVAKIKNNQVYRYYYGKLEKFKSAEKLLKYVRKKGYKSAFIVAFRGENKIKLEEALKSND